MSLKHNLLIAGATLVGIVGCNNAALTQRETVSLDNKTAVVDEYSDGRIRITGIGGNRCFVETSIEDLENPTITCSIHSGKYGGIRHSSNLLPELTDRYQQILAKAGYTN